MPFGPWKLHGLPGLILKAEANGGFSFVATGLEHTDRIMTPMYMQGDYSKVDRKKALKNAEYFANNEESIMNAQGQNVKIYSQNTKNPSQNAKIYSQNAKIYFLANSYKH